MEPLAVPPEAGKQQTGRRQASKDQPGVQGFRAGDGVNATRHAGGMLRMRGSLSL